MPATVPMLGGLVSICLAVAGGARPATQGPPRASAPAAIAFGAYYTRIRSDLPFEKSSRTGAYADVVVRVPAAGGRLVFWRGSSYLPRWESSTIEYLPVVIPRRGDGSASMPDRANALSHVRIIASSAQGALVHWRYEPSFGGDNPKTGVDARDFVDEYFAIRPDGRVRRTIRVGTRKIEAWNDPLAQTVQTLTLTPRGISGIETTPPRSSAPRGPKAVGNGLRGPVVGRPVAWWKLDEGGGDAALESVRGTPTPIAGHGSLWRRGVSGTALQLDGYFSAVTLPAESAPEISIGLTLEGWIAIGAYPWSWAPLVQRGDDGGYFLGVDGHGYPGFKVWIDGAWNELVVAGAPPYEDNLRTYRWYHLAGTYDGARGEMRLYVDGRLVGSKSVPPGSVSATAAPVRIGKGAARVPVDSYKKSPTSYSFDGLIDEVRIHDVALSAEQIELSYRRFFPGEAIAGSPDLPPRAFPALQSTGRFEARYVKLRFHEAWDNMFRVGQHADVVVSFDELPTHFVFWRGMTYIPHMVDERGHWYTNEFNETWASGGQEPMADQQTCYSRVRIIESNPARVVVHWRYPLINTAQVIARFDRESGWGEWCDWYWTIYPDGIAVKRMRCWHAFQGAHEWHTGWPTMPPGQRPEDVVELDPFLTLIDLEGRIFNHRWDRSKRIDFSGGKNIHLIHLKGSFDPVDISDNRGGNAHFGDGGVQAWYSDFPVWNHWPIALSANGGRPASFADRASHSSLIRATPQVYAKEVSRAPWEERLMLEGMTNAAPAELVTLARSWLRAPPLKIVSGAEQAGYDRSQRAYALTAIDREISFELLGSPRSPIHNPAFVIRRWPSPSARAELRVDGKAQTPGPDFRQGIAIATDGTCSLVIWLDREARRTERYQIR